MKRKIIGIVLVMLLFSAIIIPVTGTMNDNKNQCIIKSVDSDDLPIIDRDRNILPINWFLNFFNGDWNYWDNSPDMFAIPDGSVGIGITNPRDKLHVKTTSEEECAVYAEVITSAQMGGPDKAAIYGYVDTSVGHFHNDCSYGVYGYSESEYGVYGLTDGFCASHGRAGVCGAIASDALIATGILGLDDESLKSPNPLSYGKYAGYFLGRVQIEDGSKPAEFDVDGSIEADELLVRGPINILPTPEPSNPGSGFVIYCDESDMDLKAKSASGVVTVLAMD